MNRETFYSARSAYRNYVRNGTRRTHRDDSAVTSAAFRSGERGPVINLGSPLDGLTPREARAVMARPLMQHEHVGPVRLLPRAWTSKMQTKFWIAQTNVKRDTYERRRDAERAAATPQQVVMLSPADAALIDTFAPMSALHKQCFPRAA